jgi:hypothetical protein
MGAPAMFLTLFVSSVETALISMEAANVISMRMQILSKGNAEAGREVQLMVAEKIAVFTQAAADIMFGASDAMIRNNLRSAIQANQARLSALYRG